MKKEKILSISILFINLLLLSCIFESCKSNSSTVVPTSSDSVKIFSSLLESRFGIKAVPPTDPIPDADAADFRKHFNEQFSKLAYKDVWVDKSVIFKAFSDPSVDGFIITPICYTKNGTTGSGHKYNAEDVNFMIKLTTYNKSESSHSALAGGGYDFNNPCPNYPNCP